MLRSTRFFRLAATVAGISLVAACANDATAPAQIEADQGSWSSGSGGSWSSGSGGSWSSGSGGSWSSGSGGSWSSGSGGSWSSGSGGSWSSDDNSGWGSSNSGSNSGSSWQQCSAQGYAADSAVIGSKGGEIRIGKNRFTVPKGALNAPTLITMELLADTVRSVRFGPEGLTFNSNALPELKLDYASCGKNRSGRTPSQEKVKVVYINEQLDVLEVLPSVGNDVNQDVDAPIKHFSRYAVYY